MHMSENAKVTKVCIFPKYAVVPRWFASTYIYMPKEQTSPSPLEKKFILPFLLKKIGCILKFDTYMEKVCKSTRSFTFNQNELSIVASNKFSSLRNNFMFFPRRYSKVSKSHCARGLPTLLQCSIYNVSETTSCRVLQYFIHPSSTHQKLDLNTGMMLNGKQRSSASSNLHMKHRT